ncbi:hypothetical protein MOQ_003829 [Trypanosoma cruzi marinkellei]|uniref:Thioredoxin domain-containing protein n=1 Tax=Trypanosoma cruzi marinkellei TaxID=85056 RepID=K2N308_TRYCR|nr:hypothetical protein MOQ_003829 [Trypanosoma cruzi marinkellei]
MHSTEKRGREEMEVAAVPTVHETGVTLGEGDDDVWKKKTKTKGPQLDNDIDDNTTNNNEMEMLTTHKKSADLREEQPCEKESSQHLPSVKGVSFDGWGETDGSEMATNDIDVEEPTLFFGPTHAVRDEKRNDGNGVNLRCVISDGQNQRPDAAHDGCRAPHTVGAVTTLYSLRQLEELIGSTPLPIPHADVLTVTSSSSASQSLRLKAGETVLIVLHRSKGDAEVLPQHTTEQLSNCRIFVLDLGELPSFEYEEKSDVAHPNGQNERGVGTGFLQLPPTDTLLSLASQGVHDLEHVIRRVSLLLRVDEVVNANDADSSKSQTSEKGDGDEKASADASHSCKHEELALPALVMWRAEGGLTDEYCYPKEKEKTDSHGDNHDNPQPLLADTYHHGRPLVVKQLTSLDQLHSLSLLTPVYTVTHFLRTVCAKALFPDVPTADASGTRSLIYFGASWCPPCMRIVHALPTMMKEDFPCNMTCSVKADMDLATPLFEFFGVEIIPTFVIFDNEKLRTAGDWNALRNGSISEEVLSQFYEGLRRSELGRIQNSQRVTVRSFIESHSGMLKFDEDF